MPNPIFFSSLLVSVLAMPQPPSLAPRRQGATLQVQVRDIPGDPLAGVRISLESKQQTFRGETSPMGSVTLADLPAGRYRLKAEKDGYRAHAQELDLDDKGRRDLQVRLVKLLPPSPSKQS